MPLERPSLRQLIDQTVGDVQSRLPGSNPLLRHSLPGVLTRAYAGAIHGLYGLLDYAARQSNPATAGGSYLGLWATVWDITRQTPTRAAGSVVVLGEPGTDVPAGLQLQAENGSEYVVVQTAVLGDDETRVEVQAMAPGAAGNAAGGSYLMVITPIAGVDARVTVPDRGLAGGSDTERDDDLRRRLIQRITHPPHGGAAFDYERWALEIPGVEIPWVRPRYDGDGTVRVWIRERDYAGDATASQALVDQAQAYITDRTRAPVTAVVTVAAAQRDVRDVQVRVQPDAPEVRAAVTRAIGEVFARDAVPEGKILLSRLREAVSIAPGESDNAIVAPSDDMQAGAGAILALGEVAFV